MRYGPKPSKPVRRLRALGYGRVSTGRQAAHELSLDDQQRKIEEHAEKENADLVKTFIDPGRTARDDKRPDLQKMVAYAEDRANGIDLVIVYKLNRLFRNAYQFLHYWLRLKQAGVRLVSVSEHIPDGPIGTMLMTILAAVDAFGSDTNAEVVRDMMIANAMAGYWNGARPPFGYQTEVAAQFGSKKKMKLAMVEDEAAIVRLIHRLCLQGDEAVGPLGIKATCTYLNTRGITKRGRPFATSDIERVLKLEIYAGRAYYNTVDSRTRERRPEDEWIPIPAPAIITRDQRNAVLKRLASRRPTETPPRETNGPTLLTGLAKCDWCRPPDGERTGMMLRTGKSGQYRYLVCANRATKSTLSCDAPQIRMEVIDELVLGEVERQVITVPRMKALVAAMVERRDADRADMVAEEKRQREALKKAEGGIRKLYAALADPSNAVTLGDPLFREQLDALKRQRSELTLSLERLRNRLASGPAPVSDERIATFCAGVRKRLRDANPAFRRQWLRLFVDEVIVGREEIHIGGREDALLDGLTDQPAFFAPMVPNFDREWRARKDSNL